jgi:hypothetical protein
MTAPGIARLIEDLREAAARGWDDANDADRDLRAMGSLVRAFAAELDGVGRQLRGTGVNQDYPEACAEAAAGFSGLADRLDECLGGGIVGGPPGSVADIAGKLAAAIARPEPRAKNVAAPWVPGPPPLPGKPRTWPKDWRPPGMDASSLRSGGDPGHSAVPDGHFAPHYGLRQPPPMAPREARKRARRAWRLRQS